MNQGTLIAVSIVVAGGLVAGAVLAAGGVSFPASENTKVTIAPVTEDDHIVGSIDAPTIIVEYSDFECPFCSRFHPTVERIVGESEGEIAWVYRHFPLNIHANAEGSAEASECVAELAGNDAFWLYAERLFANQNRLSEGLYLSLAEELGVTQTEMQSCLDSDRHIAKVNAQLQDALNAGARGTPFSVVVGKNGKMKTFSGSLPYSDVVGVINSL